MYHITGIICEFTYISVLKFNFHKQIQGLLYVPLIIDSVKTVKYFQVLFSRTVARRRWEAFQQRHHI